MEVVAAPQDTGAARSEWTVVDDGNIQHDTYVGIEVPVKTEGNNIFSSAVDFFVQVIQV